MIPYGRQDITDEDIAAVTAVLRSDLVTQGPAIDAFEAVVASRCGVERAVAVSNATAGLHLAYLALDIGPGDLVWTAPNTFAATANAALYCGARVDFVDIDLATRNMSVPALEARLREADEHGRLPKLVVPVHFGGLSCDMAAIGALARRYGFRVVEDASHAIGATYGGRPVGACEHSDACVFSFHPVKIITTGEGGMVTSADPAIAERVARLRTHGITRDANLMAGGSEGGWYYEMLELGFNYRMTDIQAALGHSQFGRLDGYIERRDEIARGYDAALADSGLGLPTRIDGARSAYHLYAVHWPAGLGGHDRASAFAALREDGIGVNVHYIPVHMLPFYRSLGFGPGEFPNAEAHYAMAISLPMFPTLTDADQRAVTGSVRDLAGV